MDPLQLTYRTTTTRPREGLYGALMRLLSEHPILSGALGGLLATGLAAARAWRGVSQAPAIAAALGAVVVVVWIAILWGMRRFFAAQTEVEVEVTRRFTWTDEHLSWREDGVERVALERPRLRLATLAVPRDLGEKPWTVWMIWEDGDAGFVLETRVLAEEARRWPVIEAAPEDVHETLPTHIASPALEVARDKLEP